MNTGSMLSDLYSYLSNVTVETFLVNLSYLIIILGLLVKDILWLRSILVIAESAMITWGILTGNTPVAFWNSLFLGINSIQIVRLMLERKPIVLPDELNEIHMRIFKEMTKREFLYFWNTGKELNATNAQLCQHGKVQDELILILDGKVSVQKFGVEIAKLANLEFVAEMSFLTGEPASADVFVTERIRFIAWSQDKLRQLDQIHPTLLAKLHVILGKDMAHKISKL